LQTLRGAYTYFLAYVLPGPDGRPMGTDYTTLRIMSALFNFTFVTKRMDVFDGTGGRALVPEVCMDPYRTNARFHMKEAIIRFLHRFVSE
jgi:hypothetical protein